MTGVSASTAALDEHYIAHTYARVPLEIVSGHGSVAIGADGREYIDLGTGIAVNAFGMSDGEWLAAVNAQLSAVAHTSNLYYTAPGPRLAQMLCERTGMARVFFGNSGAEANEAAIKVARKYAADKYGSDPTTELPRRHTILTLDNSFHGRTITTLAATGQPHYHELFQPLTLGFVQAPAGNLAAIAAAHERTPLAAVMIEIVQGEGGVIPLEPEFVRALREWCTETGTLLIVDEVQTGNGRTGALYAYQNYGIMPDIFTTAKGLGGGLPIGAAVMSEALKDVLGPGDHGSTFGANPVSCAGALSILSRIDDDLLADVRRKAELVRGALEGADGIVSVSGMGLMIGIETVKPASEVVTACREAGVLVLTAKDRVRLLPALNISDELLAQALDALKAACK